MGSSRKVLPSDVPPGERRGKSCVLLYKKIGKINKECERESNQKSGTRIFPWKERMDLLKFSVIKFMASGWSSVWKVRDNFPAVLSSSRSFSFFSAPCFISFVEKELLWFVRNQWYLRMHKEDLMTQHSVEKVLLIIIRNELSREISLWATKVQVTSWYFPLMCLILIGIQYWTCLSGYAGILLSWISLFSHLFLRSYAHDKSNFAGGQHIIALCNYSLRMLPQWRTHLNVP